MFVLKSSIHPLIKRSFLLNIFLLFVLALAFTALTGCGNKEECEGCDDDAPWSSSKAEYCYKTKDICESFHDECQRCN